MHTFSNVSGQVAYALTFHVPLLVGRLIDEPMVVYETFEDLSRLTSLLSDHHVDMVRRAYAADEASIARLVFTLLGDDASGTLTVNDALTCDIEAHVNVKTVEAARHEAISYLEAQLKKIK